MYYLRRISKFIKDKGSVVASFSGSGGKTGAIRLAAKAFSPEYKVMVSSTTKMYDPSEWVNEVIFLPERVCLDYPCALFERFDESENKMIGIDPGLITSDLAKVVLVETDGSKTLPLKGYLDTEPVLSKNMDIYFVLAGLDCLGMKIDDTFVHRVDKLCKVTGAGPGDLITKQLLVDAICKPCGYLEKIPKGAEVIVILNKADMVEESSWEGIPEMILAGSLKVDAVCISSIKEKKDYYILEKGAE